MDLQEFKLMLQGVLDRVHPGSWEFVSLTKGVCYHIENNEICDLNLETLKCHTKRSKNLNFGVLIHFPELTVTNSDKEYITIRDLYVIVPFINMRLSNLIGTRISGTSNELAINYTHSHCAGYFNADSSRSFNGFCTNGLSISTYLQSPTAPLMTELEFEHYLYTLQKYLEWESLEGGPYRYIKNVHGKKIDSIDYMKLVTPEMREMMTDYAVFGHNDETKHVTAQFDLPEDFFQDVLVTDMYKCADGFYVKRNENLPIDRFPKIDRQLGKLHIQSKVITENENYIPPENTRITSIPSDIVAKIEKRFELLLNETLLWLMQRKNPA